MKIFLLLFCLTHISFAEDLVPMDVTPSTLKVGESTTITFTINFKNIPANIAPGVALDLGGELYQANPNGTATKVAEFSSTKKPGLTASVTVLSRAPEEISYKAKVWNKNGWTQGTDIVVIKSLDTLPEQKPIAIPTVKIKDLENVGPKDYNTLEEKCNGNSCCIASVNHMRNRGATLLKPGEKCPTELNRDMLKCKDSYQFCY